MPQKYDYIIAGAGASGLSLAWHLLQSPLKDKKVLVIDVDLTPKNDKTWCFWYSGAPPYRDLICKKWSIIEVGTPEGHISQKVREYFYYGLRSIDFEQHIIRSIERHESFDLLESAVNSFTPLPSEQAALLHSDEGTYKASYIFQSCFEPPETRESELLYPLRQHFLGWDLTADQEIFDATTCTLMDFDETFADGVAFMYLLPWDAQSGLVEYTIFSDQLAEPEVYEKKIALYLSKRFNLTPTQYQILRKERGLIPMQDRPVVPWFKPRIMNIGTRGGLTKPSTGYTFVRIQNQVQAIVEGLSSDGIPRVSRPSKFRFKAYDLWLLHILYKHPRKARDIFYHLFRNHTIDSVFRFLNEDSTLMEELKIMNSVPRRPFIKAIWKSRKRLTEI